MRHLLRQIGSGLCLAAAALLSALAGPTAQATEVGEMIGVYRAGGGGYYLWRDTSWKGLTKKWKDLGKEGLRLEDVERYVVDGEAKYAGVWREGKGRHALWATDSWSSFTKKWKDYSKDGLKLVDVETYNSGGKRRYLGVWRAGTYGTALWSLKGWDAFTKKWKALSKDGYRLIDLEGYVSGGSTHYVGVFHKGGGGYYLWKADSWAAFVDKWKKLSKDKYRLIDMERVREGNKFKYVGVYRAGKDGYVLYKERPGKFLDKWENFSESGQRLIDLEMVVTGGKPAKPQNQPKPVAANDCAAVGPYRINGKWKLKGHQYGVNQTKTGLREDSVLSSDETGTGAKLIGPMNSVKLVAGVCVQKGEVEYTLSYRGNVWRQVPMVTRVKAGQCKCYWKTVASTQRMAFKSTAKVKKPGTVYWHKASNCLRPWRNKCQVKTWDGWK